MKKIARFSFTLMLTLCLGLGLMVGCGSDGGGDDGEGSTPQPADISGDWVGTWESTDFPGGNGTLTVNITQDGNNINGTITLTGSEYLSGGTLSGTVNGNNFTMNIDFGEGYYMVSTGTISGNSISGTYVSYYNNEVTDRGNYSGSRGTQPPAPQEANVVLYGEINKTEDYNGDIKLLGELKNIGNIDATFPIITFTFKDSSGNVIGTDYAYVYGSCKTLVLLNLETHSILGPNEIGGFLLYTDIPVNNVSSYEYTIEWDEYETTQPDANVILYGSITEGEDIIGLLELSGNLKNAGTETAIFAEITFILKNGSGNVIDISVLNFVYGSNVYLPDIDYYTDTALYPNESGPFDAWTLVYPNEVSTYYYKTSWDDFENVSSSLNINRLYSNIAQTQTDDITPEELWQQRRNRIDEVKAIIQKAVKP